MVWQLVVHMLLDDFARALASEIDQHVRYDPDTSVSAVLIAVYGREPMILMTKKSPDLKLHAGEIAFPGGKMETGDDDLLETALRETREELGIDVPRSRVVGQLTPVRTLNSNFTIVPFVCILEDLPPMRPNREVDQVLHIPAVELLCTLGGDPDPDHNLIAEMYTFTFKEHIVWGASARMLKQIVDRLSRHGLL